MSRKNFGILCVGFSPEPQPAVHCSLGEAPGPRGESEMALRPGGADFEEVLTKATGNGYRQMQDYDYYLALGDTQSVGSGRDRAHPTTCS